MKNILLIYIKFITKCQLFFNKKEPFFNYKAKLLHIYFRIDMG